MVEEGILRIGDEVTLQVDAENRLATARNHTATHLLHKSLRLVLGDHVAQAGSLVSPDRLRFDFHHFQPMTSEEKLMVEQLVNDAILRNDPVKTTVMTLDEARQTGAMALFDEKYGDKVRVVSVGEFSRELCGGTHLRQSSEACLFRFVSEGGVAAGIRRIEGVTGLAAWQLVRQQDQQLHEIGSLLKTAPQELPRRVESLLEKNHQLEKELEIEHSRQTANAADQLIAKAEELAGIRTVLAQLDLPDAEQLREAADRIRDHIAPGVVILASSVQGKVLWVAMAEQQAISRGIHAGNLIREAARITGGGGGGRPDMAQAGGKNPDQIAEALTAARDLIARQLAAGNSRQ